MKDLKVILTSEQIDKRIRELGSEITRDYAGASVPLIAVCLLKGAVLFYADLVRNIDLPLVFDFMSVSSYGNAESSSGSLTVLKDLDYDVTDKDVLLIDDIVDSGATMHELFALLSRRRPHSLKICCLLDKPSRRIYPEIKPDYAGFTIPDEFVYGFGLDNGQMSRNLPYIAVKIK